MKQRHELSDILCFITRAYTVLIFRVFVLEALSRHNLFVSCHCDDSRSVRWIRRWTRSCTSWWSSSRPSPSWRPSPPFAGWRSRKPWVPALTRGPDVAATQRVWWCHHQWTTGRVRVYIDSLASYVGACKITRGLNLSDPIPSLLFMIPNFLTDFWPLRWEQPLIAHSAQLWGKLTECGTRGVERRLTSLFLLMIVWPVWLFLCCLFVAFSCGPSLFSCSTQSYKQRHAARIYFTTLTS